LSAAEKNARGGRRALSIVSTGYAYPMDRVDNDAFFARCEFPIASDRQALIDASRMRSRFWCSEGENTLTMARGAAAMAIANAAGSVNVDEIDVLLVSSCSTIPCVNYPLPENPVVADLAPLLLRDLGRDNALGIDIKATYCAGFLRCLEIMDGLLENPNYRAGLIVASDQGGRFATAETNRSAFCFIVGDAAGAVVVQKGSREGLIDYVGEMRPSLADLTAWGPDGKSLIVRGTRAQSATMEMLVSSAQRLLRRNGLTPNDLAWLLPMQTHASAIDALTAALELPKEKVLWFGDVTGYAASASIPACLGEQVRAGRVRRGDLILSLAVGAGMNSGGTLFRY
jgi:3-oxoacyl-[acyl-carrier-protein] synthase-3